MQYAPLYLTQCCIISRDGQAYLRPSNHSNYRASLLKTFLSERSTPKYWGTSSVLLLILLPLVFPIILIVISRQGSLDSTPRLPSLWTGHLLWELLPPKVLWTDCHSILEASEQDISHKTIQFPTISATSFHR